MIEEYTIGITTFSKRLNFITNLLNQIRNFTDKKIVLVINGEQNGNFNEGYRQNILSLSLSYKDIYPIFFIETRGLAKLWNTALIASTTENMLVLNDDIEIYTNDIFNVVVTEINNPSYTGLTKINGGFSHYIVNKDVLHNLGYFDERLLGFGEEDGDITHRLLQKNSNVRNIQVPGVNNIVSDIRHDFIKPGMGKYSKFNREFINNKKYTTNHNSPYQGMFDTPMDQVLEDINLYPYESFFKENKNNL